ncbi:hypothetical protein D9M72_225630 [compost metagenome]
MRTPARLIAAALTLLAAQSIAAPAQAHLTDPPHGEWMAGFGISEAIPVYAPGTSFQTNPYVGSYNASEPFTGTREAPRTYDFTFPAGFTITYTNYFTSQGPGDCTVTGTTVHCESGNDTITSTNDDVITLAGTTGQVPDGTYQITSTGTLTVNSPTTGEAPKTYTDTGSTYLEIRAQRTTDLSTTGPSPTPPVSAGVATKINVHVRNNGPATARDVFFSARPQLATISTSTSGCSTSSRSTTCQWATLAPGEMKTIEVLITPDQPKDQMILRGTVRSFENDPKPDNDSWQVAIKTK